MKKFVDQSYKDTILIKDENGSIVNHEFESNWGSLCVEALNHVGESGIRPQDMRDRIKVIEKFEKLDGKRKSIELEDAEFKILFDCWNSIKWKHVKRPIMELDEYLTKLNK